MTPIRGGGPPRPVSPGRSDALPRRSRASAAPRSDELTALARDHLSEARADTAGGDAPARSGVLGWLAQAREAAASVTSRLASRWSGATLGSLLGAAALVGSAGAAHAATVAPPAPDPPQPDGAPVAELRSAQARSGEHTVVSGDTLWGIARAHGVSLKKLLLYNPQILDPNMIHPGDHVTLPPGARVQAVDAIASHLAGPAATTPTGGATPASAAHATTASAPPAASADATMASAAPAAAAASVAPAAAAASAASTPAAASTPTAPSARTRTSVAARVLRWIDARLTEAATSSSTRVRTDVDLGALGRGDVELRPFVRLSDDTTPARARFEAAERAAGREVLWIETTLGAKVTPPAGGLLLPSSTASLDLAVTRPLAFKGDDARLPRIAGQLVDRLTQAPLSTSSLLSLEQGSRVVLRGEGTLARATAASPTTPASSLRGRLELRVERLDGTRVEARLSATSAASLLGDRDGTRLEGGVERAADRVFTLDLATPAGAEALGHLVRLDGAAARALGEAPGVTVDSSTTRLAGRAGVVHTTADGARAAVRVSGEERAEGPTRSRTSTTAAELGSTGSAARPEVGLTASSELRAAVDGDGALPREAADVIGGRARATLETARRAGLDARWDGATEHPSTLRAALEHREVYTRTSDEGGERRETGALELSGRWAREDGHMSAERTVRYELRTPLDHPAPEHPPVDAAAFRALPASSRLELTHGRGAAAAVSATLDVSGELSLRTHVVATRGEGDAVEVRVVRTRHDEHKVGATVVRGPAERRVTLGAHDGGHRTDAIDRTYTLDLSRPEHATAFARLLEGDAAGAARALGSEAPVVSRDRLRELSAKLGVEAPDSWSFGVELTRRVHEPTSALIVGNTDRATRGGDRWIERVGLVAPSVTARTTTPVGGGAGSIKTGLTAEGLVEVRQITPENDDRVLTLDPDGVLSWARGSEVTLRGRGRATGFVDAGVGHSVSAGPATVGARASVSESHSEEKSYVLGVRRGEGTRVSLELRETRGTSDAIAAFARVGVTTDLRAAVDLPAGNARNDAIIKALERVDRATTDRLVASVEGSLSRSAEVDHKTEVEVDLAEPRGRSLFEAIVHFDAAQARALAQSGLSISDTDSVARRTHAGASVFGWDAFRLDTARIDAHTVATAPSGVTTTDASSFHRTSRTLLGRERTLDWHAVAVSRDGAAPELMYRVQFHDKDRLTSRHQVDSLLSLVGDLELSTVSAPRVERASDRGLAALLGEHAQHGRTEVDLELYLTRGGLDALRTTDEATAWRTFGDVVARGGARPGWAREDVGVDARRLLTEHFQHRSDTGVDAQHNDNAAYWWLTGRNLYQDTESFENARAFTDLVRRMGSTTSPAEWNRAFADLGEQTGYPFYDAVSAMRRIGGPSSVLAHRLRMTGPAVNIEAVGSGLTEVPLLGTTLLAP